MPPGHRELPKSVFDSETRRHATKPILQKCQRYLGALDQSSKFDSIEDYVDGIGSGGLVVTFNKTTRDIYTAALATVPSIHKNTTWLSALTDAFLLLTDVTTVEQALEIAAAVPFVNSTIGLATVLGIYAGYGLPQLS